MSWFKKPRPKEDHRMREEWERVRKVAGLPISHLTGLPYDPELIERRVPPSSIGGLIPCARVDPRLIGKEYR